MSIVNPYGLWSRPSLPSVIGVRPNSPPQMTRVSSNSPRAFRSLIRAVVGPPPAVHLVELLDELQFRPLAVGGHVALEVQDRAVAGPEQRALVGGRHVPRAPVARPAGHLAAVGHDHVAGQVLVDGAEP